jgi:hypothetical protein
MPLRKYALFLMEDSSSYDDFDWEDILFDDDEQLLLMIAVKEQEDNKRTKRPGQRSAGYASLGIARSGIACSCNTTSRRYPPIRPISFVADIKCDVHYL